VDELDLRRKGRQLPLVVVGILFLAGVLGLAGLPPFGTFLGKGMIEDAAEKQVMRRSRSSCSSPRR